MKLNIYNDPTILKIGYVYRVYYSLDPNIFYIGSTTNLISRMQNHKWNSKCINSKEYNSPFYKCIRHLGGMDAFQFEVLDQLIFYKPSELKKIENNYINELKPPCNSINAIKSLDYFKTSNYKSKQCLKYQKNRNKILQKHKEKYTDEYKEEKRKNALDYYYKNKERICEQKKLKVQCICGCKINNNNKLRHITSKKHKQGMKDLFKLRTGLKYSNKNICIKI